MPEQSSVLARCLFVCLIAIPLLAALPLACRVSPETPVVNSPHVADDRLPISIEIDGRYQELVTVPRDLFDGGFTTNLTQNEIGGGVEKGRKRGTGLYPTGSLANFDLAKYLSAVHGAAQTHVPERATGIATLDFEGGLYPWAEKSKDKYKDDLTDAQFETQSHQFFVRSLRVAKAARPDVKWGYWGYPRPWQGKELIDRMADIYSVCEAIAPSLYIRRSGDAKAIRRDVAEIGKLVALIKDIHPRSEEVVVAAYLWNNNAAGDHQRPRAQATIEDMLLTARSAEAWADKLVIWVGAGTEGEARELTKSLAPGGHIHTFIDHYRQGTDPTR